MLCWVFKETWGVYYYLMDRYDGTIVRADDKMGKKVYLWLARFDFLGQNFVIKAHKMLLYKQVYPTHCFRLFNIAG